MYTRVFVRYVIFIADNVLLVEVARGDVPGGAAPGVVPGGGATRLATIRINKIPIEIATCYFNDAISFVPCFKVRCAAARRLLAP